MSLVYDMVKANVVCIDCAQEIFSDLWEPVLVTTHGEHAHAVLCNACIYDMQKTRDERIVEEDDLIAILADGTGVHTSAYTPPTHGPTAYTAAEEVTV